MNSALTNAQTQKSELTNLAHTRRFFSAAALRSDGGKSFRQRNYGKDQQQKTQLLSYRKSNKIIYCWQKIRNLRTFIWTKMWSYSLKNMRSRFSTASEFTVQILNWSWTYLLHKPSLAPLSHFGHCVNLQFTDRFARVKISTNTCARWHIVRAPRSVLSIFWSESIYFFIHEK